MRSIVIILLGAVSYGLLSTFVKLAYQSGFSTNEVIGSQMLFGVVMMVLLLLFVSRTKKGPLMKGVSVKTLLSLLPIGITVGATSIFYYSALKYIPASIAIVLLFQFSWMGVLIEAVVERKRPGKEKLIALVLVLAGTAMAGGLTDGGWKQFTMVGVILGLLSAFSYSLFIALSGKAALQVAPVTRSTIIVAISAVFISFVYPPTFVLSGALGHGLLFWGFLLAFFGVVIPPLCFAIGVPKTGGGLASILSAAELPVAVVMSGIVLQEHVTMLQWVGVVIILVGVTLPELLTRHKRTPSTPLDERPVKSKRISL